MTLRTITAGVDGTPESFGAAMWAADEAADRGLDLRLMHVCDAGAVSGRKDAAMARGRGRQLLDQLVTELACTRPALPVETVQFEGEPVDELCRTAADAELIVLGSRGLGSFAGFVAGSVSLGVLARTRRPAVLVRERGARPAARPDGDVVVGFDPRRGHDDVLDFAFGAAERYGGALRAVHAWSLPGLYGPDLAGCTSLLQFDCMGEHGRATDEALAPWAEKYPAVTVHAQCGQGRAAQALVEASRDAKLVVVGRRSRPPGPRGRVGPVTHAVVHHATAPIAVIPH